jgi:hypothetical protein
MPLVDAVRHAVDGRGLSVEQTRRVTEMANRLTWQHHLQGDRMTRFDPANFQDVLGPASGAGEAAPSGPLPAPAQERVPLYQSPNKPQVQPDMKGAHNYAGSMRAAAYEAEASLSHHRQELGKAAGDCLEEAVRAVQRGEDKSTLAAVVAATERDAGLGSALFREILEELRWRGLQPGVSKVGEEVQPDPDHPFVQACCRVNDAYQQVKAAAERVTVFRAFARGAADVVTHMRTR